MKSVIPKPQEQINYQHLTGRPSTKDACIALWMTGKRWPWFHPIFNNLDLRHRDFHKRQFNRVSISGCDFTSSNFSDADLSHCYIVGTDFTGANLSHTNFYGAEIIRCDFSGADLSGANFEHCILISNKGVKNKG